MFASEFDRSSAPHDAVPGARPTWLRMARLLPRALLAAALAMFIAVPWSGPANADSSIKSRLIGAWIFVSSVNTRRDGSNYDRWGSNPAGILMFDSSGRFSQIIMRSESSLFGPKSVFSFGTFYVDEANSMLITEIEGGSLHKLRGTKQRRQIKLLNAQELRYLNIDGVGGAAIDAVWKRAPTTHPHSASLLKPR